MSFSLTERALKAGRKSVTRRRTETWKSLKVGDKVRAVNKVMGMRKGEKAQTWGYCEIVSVRVEPLNRVTDLEATLEGFPGMTGAQFVDFFCERMKCGPSELVRRIEFRFEAA